MRAQFDHIGERSGLLNISVPKWAAYMLFALLGGATLGVLLDKKKKESPEVASVPQAASVSEVGPVARSSAIGMRLSPSSLVESLRSNELRTRRDVSAAGGVVISARVKAVEADIFGAPRLTFATDEQFIDVLASLDRSQKNRAIEVNIGEYVSVLCHSPSWLHLGASVSDCTFVK